MKERAIGLWNEESFITSSMNPHLKPYDDELRYEMQETLIEVMEEARVCALKDSNKGAVNALNIIIIIIIFLLSKVVNYYVQEK